MDSSVVLVTWRLCSPHLLHVSLKIALATEDLDPSNTWFLRPTRVHNPNVISISLAVFEGLTNVTDRQTDRQTTLLSL